MEPKLSFRARVIAAILLSQFLIVLIGLGLQMWHQYRSMRRFLRESSLTYATCIAHGCSPSLCVGDARTLERYLEMARSAHGDRFRHAEIRAASEADVRKATVMEGGSEGVDFEILVPVTEGERRIGTLRLGVSEAWVAREMRPLFLQGLTLMLVALVAGGGLAFLVDRRLRGALKELAKVTQATSRGDLGVRARIATGDELQELGDAFNRMAESLQRSQREIQKWNETLEETVRERTADLAAERRKLDGIVEGVGAAILLLDSEFRVLFANTIARRWFPREGDPVGRRCSLALWGEERRCADCASLEAIRSKRIVQKERRIATGGVETWYQITASPVLGPDGRVVQVLELIQDITEKKRIDAQLLMAGKMVSLGEMAAGIAHEINNPLAVIGASAERIGTCLRNGAPSGKLAGYVDSIERQTFRAKTIIQDLLHFARHKEPDRRDTDVRQVLEEAILLIRHRSHLGEIRIESEFEADLPRLWSDADGLQQVFLNLLSNAVDAIGDRGEVRVRAARREGAVCVSVSDTGCGIAPEHLPLLMTPFFTTKPPGKGTGLGLAISMRILDRLGARMDVRSVLGKGTTFEVLIPNETRDSRRG